MPLKAIDFFCGAGGLTRGLLDSGIRVVGGFDINENCRETYERNNSGARFLHKNIENVTVRDLKKLLGEMSPDKVLFAGCAPCQPFTKQRREGEYSGQRTLLGDFARLVSAFRPGYVVMENVPGIAKIEGNSTYRRFLKTLEDCGYRYKHGQVDAKDYGVPQNRKRWVVVASRIGEPRLPTPTHGPLTKRPYKTVRAAIGELPRIAAGDTHPTVPNHKCSNLSEINQKRLRSTAKNGGSRAEWDDALKLKCHSGAYEGHSDVYGRMRWDFPAPTLTCKCYSISNGRYGHPSQNRAISFREAASLQSFPTDYVFYGISQKDIGSQIGNAVPVLLGKALGCAVKAVLAPRRAGDNLNSPALCEVRIGRDQRLIVSVK